MGGADALRAAIDEIQSDGGHVILYTNGCLIDLQSDFYKLGGQAAAMLDIDGNEYRNHYHFAGQGLTLRQFGYKSFALGCMATEAWADRLVKQGRVMLQLRQIRIFYDHDRGHPTLLCFNKSHPHGPRVDRDWTYRPGVFRQMKALCPPDVALGTENNSDIGCAQADNTHNSAPVKPQDPTIFPYLFRYTLAAGDYLHQPDRARGVRRLQAGPDLRLRLRAAFLRLDLPLPRPPGPDAGIHPPPGLAQSTCGAVSRTISSTAALSARRPGTCPAAIVRHRIPPSRRPAGPAHPLEPGREFDGRRRPDHRRRTTLLSLKTRISPMRFLP
jgi:hypothetical protein